MDQPLMSQQINSQGANLGQPKKRLLPGFTYFALVVVAFIVLLGFRETANIDLGYYWVGIFIVLTILPLIFWKLVFKNHSVIVKILVIIGMIASLGGAILTIVAIQYFQNSTVGI